jgi:osmotically-inducible protein OsmY
VKYLTAFALVLVAASCTTQKPDKPNPPLRALGQDVVVEETRSDESIGTEVRRQLDLVGPADTAAVVVEVDAGRVKLRGLAPTLAAAWRAESAARAVKGVKSVVNEIQILGQPLRP